MSDAIPDTADRAIREFLGAIGFTLVLVGGDMMAEATGTRFGLGVVLALCALPVYLAGWFWNKISPRINHDAVASATAFVERLPWWIRGALIVIFAFVLSQVIGSSALIARAFHTPPETSIQLQFFGDSRIPVMTGQSNVYRWVAVYSPEMGMTATDVNGEKHPLVHVGPSWDIFLVFNEPAIYRQPIASFSNPEKMGPYQFMDTSDRSLVLHTQEQIPAGILEIKLLR